MAKLYELLAAEASAVAGHDIVAEETVKVFARPDAFVKTTKTTTYFSEEDHKLDTLESKDNITTVRDRLEYSFGAAFISRLDMMSQRDRTNQEARADVIINGEVLLAQVPGITLLALETFLAKKRKELEAIPTLQPGPVWIDDVATGLRKAAETKVSFRTKKTIRAIVLSPATDRHPAQVQAINEDVPIAKIEDRVWSGMATSNDKHNYLARIEALIVAVKKARQRANSQEVVKLKIGDALAGFILDGPTSDKLTGVDTVAA